MLVSLSMNFVLIELSPVLWSNTANVYKFRNADVHGILPNDRTEPILTDAARCPNDSNAQKADFAKLPFKVSLARPDRPRWSEALRGSAAL